MPSREGTYGLLAEFDTPGDLVRAAGRGHGGGEVGAASPP